MTVKGCKCIDNALPQLALQNTRLVVLLSFTGECDKVVVATDRLEKKRDGKKALTVIATYCPFCGKKYPTKKEPKK